MSTIDDINNSFALDKQRNYPSTLTQQDASSVQPVNDGLSDKQRNYPSAEHKETPVQLPSDEGKKQQPVVVTPSPAKSEPAAKRTLSWVDMYKRLNPYTPPTAEELEAERKKQKRDAVFAAIGDGLNAFHQAYANARGVKPIAENTSISGKMLDRYEKLKKERDALSREYAAGMMRAAQMDQEQSNWREKMDYQKGRDAKADERDQRNFDYTKQQDRQKQQNWQKIYDRQSDQWKQEFDARERQYGRQNALAWAAHNLAVQTRKDTKELGEKRIQAQAARGVRGKQIAFSDGSGNNVGIYENVWKGSMEQVYDAMVAEFNAQAKANAELKRKDPNAKVPDVPRALPSKATAQQKDDFVKQHWHKSSAAKQLMGALSRIDPATMTSATSNTGAYDQYEVKNDDYSQYEVK